MTRSIDFDQHPTDHTMLPVDDYYIALARQVSQQSKDPSVQTGCMVVDPRRNDPNPVVSGINRFPDGIDDTIASRWERPEKYEWCEHAERNAFYYAARHGIATDGCTIYTEPPCTPCARAIIQAGIRRIVMSKLHSFRNRPDWEKDLEFAINMLTEAGVAIHWTEK